MLTIVTVCTGGGKTGANAADWSVAEAPDKGLPWMALTAWGVVMAVYSELVSRPADRASAHGVGIPDWYLALRPFLLPEGFLQGTNRADRDVRTEGDSYLMGNWPGRDGGTTIRLRCCSRRDPVDLATRQAGVVPPTLRQVAFEQWLRGGCVCLPRLCP